MLGMDLEIFSRCGPRRAGSMNLSLASSTGDALNLHLCFVSFFFFFDDVTDGLRSPSLSLPFLAPSCHVSQKKKRICLVVLQIFRRRGPRKSRFDESGPSVVHREVLFWAAVCMGTDPASEVHRVSLVFDFFTVLLYFLHSMCRKKTYHW